MDGRSSMNANKWKEDERKSFRMSKGLFIVEWEFQKDTLEEIYGIRTGHKSYLTDDYGDEKMRGRKLG